MCGYTCKKCLEKLGVVHTPVTPAQERLRQEDLHNSRSAGTHSEFQTETEPDSETCLKKLES